ncbi:MAG: T9SS type A sorting domain-containing protein [candidate division Zixibacteria bacterium]|nr:T9SS type A sorting domain-containing protein [candidate division Zixibacteria bacterium]
MPRKQHLWILTIVFLIGVSPIFAQAPDTVWTKIYGLDHHEIGECIQKTSDNCYIIAGNTHSISFGGYDAYLLKTDLNGDTLWTRHYGSPQIEYGRWVVETADGGFMIVGSYNYYEPYATRDVYMVKTDSEGFETWTRTYGGPEDDYARQIKALPSGDFIVIGSTKSYGSGDYDFWLLYLNAYGDTLWTNTIGGPYCEYSYAVEPTSDNGFIIAGVKNGSDANAEDVYIVKTNITGDTLWTRKYGYSRGDRAFDIKETSDGGFIVVGYMTSESSSYLRDMYILKTDSNGDTLWTTTFDGGFEDWANSVRINNTGNYMITGKTERVQPDTNYVAVLCYNADGDTVWTKQISRGIYSEGNCIIQADDGGYVITGSTTNFYDDDWERDLYMVKLAAESTDIDDYPDKPVPDTFILMGNNPNPFNANTTIKYSLPTLSEVTLDIYDVLGRKVQTFHESRLPAGSHSLIWNADGFSSGVYFYKVTAGEFERTEKMILLK